MIRSLLTLDTPLSRYDDIVRWLEERNADVKVEIKPAPLADLSGWTFTPEGWLAHSSGRFFSIRGIRVDTDYGPVQTWEQPIIYQPEIGYLGIIVKEFDGVLHFLMQAKVEPGNVNNVQLSPTIQATKSNYSRVHKGKTPAYLEYFINAKPEQIILDQLQSEQGARFLRKRNRNIIIRIEDEIEVLPDFKWVTLGQIKKLCLQDNKVNMDTRTVISGIDFSRYYDRSERYEGLSALGSGIIESLFATKGLFTIDGNISWLSRLKSRYELTITQKSLSDISHWQVGEYEISRPDGQFFKVIGVDVTISNREVATWSQPLVQPSQQGICAMIMKYIGGVAHFLMQAKLECGNYDVLELAPTVQCLTGRYDSSSGKVAYLDYVLNAKPEDVLYSALQSEEGGRFYREQNRNMLIMAGDDFPEKTPERYRWMTMRQIFEFLKYNNFINIQARSLIAAINYLHL